MFHALFFQKYFNRAHLNSVFFVVAYSLLMLSFAFGNTITNFGQWRNLNSISKTAYAAGAIDTFINPLEAGGGHKEFVDKLQSCLSELNITIVEVTQMIDNFYANSENWGYSPQDAIKFQLINGHCFQFLN